MTFFYQLRVKIESKRSSEKLIWRILVLLKDAIGRIKYTSKEFIYYNTVFRLYPLTKRCLILKASQKEKELNMLIDFLMGRRLNSIFEIGCHKGGTLYLWCRLGSGSAKIVTIDLVFKRKNGTRDSEEVIRQISKYRTRRQKLHFMVKDSHSDETRRDLEIFLNGDKLDFLFIDGDHSYEGVKSDFEMYFGLVNDGGIIAFHDIVSGNYASVGEVPRFWNEIKSKFEHREFVADWRQGGFGIGVIIKKSN